jgi:allantoin racemase
MKLLVVNRNTSASMTGRIGAAARAAAAAGTEIVAVNSESGPASIEGYFDEAFAVPSTLALRARSGRWSRARAGTGA